MNKTEIQIKNEEYFNKFKKDVELFQNQVLNAECFDFDDSNKQTIIRLCESMNFYPIYDLFIILHKPGYSTEFTILIDELSRLNSFTNKNLFHHYDEYVDPEPIYFDDDIIITDPSYIIRQRHQGINPMFKDDWKACLQGKNMEKLGIRHYITHSTLRGDCSYEIKMQNGRISECCTDSGIIGVFLFDEIMDYNCKIDFVERPWSCTMIENFKGYIHFSIINNGTGEEENFILQINGEGVDKITNEPIKFTSSLSK